MKFRAHCAVPIFQNLNLMQYDFRFLVCVLLIPRNFISTLHMSKFFFKVFKKWTKIMNLYYKGRCLSSPPVLKLWDTQGYLWLPYDLTEVIKLIGETFGPKMFFFSQKNTLCHSFRITVIPSILLSFLPD